MYYLEGVKVASIDSKVAVFDNFFIDIFDTMYEKGTCMRRGCINNAQEGSKYCQEHVERSEA